MHVNRLAIGLLPVLALSSGAHADTKTVVANIDNWGWMDLDNNSASVELVFEETFALPNVASISSVMFELAHPRLDHLHLTLTSPTNDVFVFTRGRSNDLIAPYDGAFDRSGLGANPDAAGVLADVRPYFFVASGLAFKDGNDLPDPPIGGSFTSVAWHPGPWGAGNWTIRVEDAWDTIAAGALGEMQIDYRIPSPGTLALLGVVPLALRRRRP
jgi:hypothetical protein